MFDHINKIQKIERHVDIKSCTVLSPRPSWSVTVKRKNLIRLHTADNGNIAVPPSSKDIDALVNRPVGLTWAGSKRYYWDLRLRHPSQK